MPGWLDSFEPKGIHPHDYEPMAPVSRAAVQGLILLSGLAAFPAIAKVLADGKPSPGGFYWQKVEKADKSIQYMCRSNKEAGVQKSAKCEGAKAVKPK